MDNTLQSNQRCPTQIAKHCILAKLDDLIAKIFPVCTHPKSEDPRGQKKLRLVCDAVRKPMEEHTGARMPRDPG